MRPAHAALFIAVLTTCLAACARTDYQPSEAELADYTSRRVEEYGKFTRADEDGTGAGKEIWECALIKL